jgi:aldehyde:ferredoxin oxidoreductase
MDAPPQRWFNEPLTQGQLKGAKLDPQKYNGLLQSYYKQRGWTSQGIPTKETLEKLGLAAEVTSQLGVA